MENRNLESIFRQCFSDYSVENDLFINNRLFHNIMILDTNAQDKKSFLNASVEYSVGEGLPCYWFWTKAIEEITESYCGENKETLRDCVFRLFKFLQDENNSNYNVWHGHSDIRVDRCLVKIGTEVDECGEDKLEYELTDPVAKKVKIEDNVTETRDWDDGSEFNGNVYNEIHMRKHDVENTLDQVFAQTITNAFYQAKDNPELKNLFIPSFLATDEKVQILMYNVENDRMLKSQDMELFSDTSDNGLNNGTVICIWMALNFIDFQQKDLENEFEDIRFEKSGFQERLPDEILSIYQSELKSPLLKNESEKENQNVKGTAYHLWNSEHTRRMKERLDALDEKYWT
ncbi:unnamed protein product [Mytilus edulis]|uniref:Uncharacterized protein n=1 Tax=Mytilus edulis TaxID=6550 RepID=A0A8S3VAM4_MYTED|nr:unnamed protein product [Mytilus edulis]